MIHSRRWDLIPENTLSFVKSIHLKKKNLLQIRVEAFAALTCLYVTREVNFFFTLSPLLFFFNHLPITRKIERVLTWDQPKLWFISAQFTVDLYALSFSSHVFHSLPRHEHLNWKSPLKKKIFTVYSGVFRAKNLLAKSPRDEKLKPVDFDNREKK